MPKRKEHPDDQIIKREQQTNPGLIATAGSLQHNDYDDIEWTTLQKSYKKILDGCPITNATMKLMKYPLMSVSERFDLPKNASDRSKECQEFLYHVKDKVLKSYRYYKKHKLRAIDFGCSLHEKIIDNGYKYKFIKDGKQFTKLTNRILKLSPIQNDTIEGFYYDKIGEFDYIKHEKRIPDYGNDYIEIKAENLQIFTFNEYDNDIRGNSILRPIRFYFEAGQKLLQSKVINSVKGTGIIGIHTKQTVTGSEKADLEKLGRSLMAMTDGYYLIDTSRAEVIMNELKGQGDFVAVLEFINRMKLYNTMSQFMAAGLGQNGSRAATESHKSPYEMSLNYILNEYDEDERKFWNWIIDISYLSDLPDEERPVFKSEPITQTDMLKESQIINNLTLAGFTWTDVDKNIIREKLNFPVSEIKTNQTTIQDDQEIDAVKDEVKVSRNALQDKKLSRNVGQEILEFERNIFEFDSANDHFITIQDEVHQVIDEYMHSYILDIIRQLQKDKNKNINIRPGILQGFKEKLEAIYEKGYTRGEGDVKKEIAKLIKKELALDPIEKKSIKSSIDKLSKKLFFNVKTTIEVNVSKLSDSFLKTKGGIDEYLLTFETGFKTDKNGIVKEVEHSYTSGRGNIMKMMQDNIELYLITSKLDKNLCEECVPYDGGIYTVEELNSIGFDVGSTPVNPYCLGWNNCRCQMVVYKMKERL